MVFDVVHELAVTAVLALLVDGGEHGEDQTRQGGDEDDQGDGIDQDHCSTSTGNVSRSCASSMSAHVFNPGAWTVSTAIVPSRPSRNSQLITAPGAISTQKRLPSFLTTGIFIVRCLTSVARHWPSRLPG